jgi:hypothetical protein
VFIIIRDLWEQFSPTTRLTVMHVAFTEYNLSKINESHWQVPPVTVIRFLLNEFSRWTLELFLSTTKIFWLLPEETDVQRLGTTDFNFVCFRLLWRRECDIGYVQSIAYLNHKPIRTYQQELIVKILWKAVEIPFWEWKTFEEKKHTTQGLINKTSELI